MGRSIITPLVEGGAGADEGDEVRRVERPPALFSGFDELEGHGEAGCPRPGSLGDVGPQSHGGEGRLDRIGGLEVDPVLGREVVERMTIMTTTDVTAIPAIEHREAMKLQATELERALEFLRTLDPEQWSTQTTWPDWDVRRMWLHVLGACEAKASMRENMHQMSAGRKRRKNLGGSLEAGLSAVQVAEREDLSPQELLERLERIAPKGVKGRTRTPHFMRAVLVGGGTGATGGRAI